MTTDGKGSGGVRSTDNPTQGTRRGKVVASSGRARERVVVVQDWRKWLEENPFASQYMLDYVQGEESSDSRARDE